MRAKLITPPASEPVTLATAKAHLRETGTDQDDLIAIYIESARRHVEQTTGARCITQKWQLVLDKFPDGGIRLPGYPLISVESVGYIDPAGVAQTITVGDLVINTASRPGVIYNPDEWPATEDREGVVTIDYTVGFGAAATDVPADLRNAMLLLIGDYFENRQGQQKETLAENPAVASLLFPYRVMSP